MHGMSNSRYVLALTLTLLYSPVSLGQVIDGTASWWDPPAQYVGACNVPVNAWGPNFIATAIQNWQRGGSGVCGQQIQITSKSNGARLIGYVTDLCLENCTDTTDIQLSLSFWKQLYGGNASPASQLTVPIKFELVGSPVFPPPSSQAQASTGAPTRSTMSSAPGQSPSSQKNVAAASRTSKSSSQTASSTQSSTSAMTAPTGAIVGAAVGGVALAAIISLIVLFFVRRRRREQRRNSVELRPSTDRNRSDSSHLPMVSNAYTPRERYDSNGIDPETRRSTLTHSSSQNRLSSHRKPVPIYDPDMMSEFPVRNSGVVIPDSAHPSWRDDPYLSSYPRPRSPYRETSR